MTDTNKINGVIDTVFEALQSKKFMAAAAMLGITWSEVGPRLTDTKVLIATIAASALVASSYILGQSLVDAAKEHKK